MKIILGSASQTRKMILEEAGIIVDGVMTADIDEKAIRCDDFSELVLMLSRAKREALRPRISEPAFLITGDIVLFKDKVLFEKPTSADEERKFLRLYDGEKSFYYAAGITVTNTATNDTREGVIVGEIIIGPFDENFIEAYIARGTYMNYAGGFCYGGDSEFPAMTKKLTGGADALMGMPVDLTKQFLRELGWEKTQ